MRQRATKEQRQFKVIKDNDLIQKARFQLSEKEQKVILYLISKIKPRDADFVHQDFSVAEFCHVCGIYNDSGNNYKNVKEAIKSLADKSTWITLDSGVEVLVRWIEKAWVYKNTGTVKIRLDNDIKPYLLQLRENFTEYELLYILAMQSRYSIRLYEILRSYAYKQRVIFDIGELKRKISAENYTRYPDFKRYVLDISMREINDLSDIAVKYEIIKEGRKYSKLEFSIRLKTDHGERLETWARIDEIIDPPQLTIFDCEGAT
ncbi:MAG: replication initiation protein [Defluviitaleaceae bacterium]|nr:replication initiation protein [Defluviitaleaceae bacterium]